MLEDMTPEVRPPSPCADGVPSDLLRRTVADGMLVAPTVFGEDTRVADLAAFFEDDHVHAALVVDGSGRLVTVVDPADLMGRPATDLAATLGRLTDRTIPSTLDLATTWWSMRHSGRRRLAVVDAEGHLLGLLCLTRSGRGFCSDADVEARRRERASVLTPA